jgi:elongation factor 1-beta
VGSYVIRLKILPQDTTTEHQKIVDSVSAALPPTASIRAHRVEPIAYGLSAIIIDVTAPEEEGMIDKIEQLVASAPLVSQSEVVGASRMSSKLPLR